MYILYIYIFFILSVLVNLFLAQTDLPHHTLHDIYNISKINC